MWSSRGVSVTCYLQCKNTGIGYHQTGMQSSAAHYRQQQSQQMACSKSLPMYQLSLIVLRVYSWDSWERNIP